MVASLVLAFLLSIYFSLSTFMLKWKKELGEEKKKANWEDCHEKSTGRSLGL